MPGIHTSTRELLTEDDLSLPAVQAAAVAIRPYVVRTPTVQMDRLAEMLERPVVGKLETLQHTGAFKVRGAFNRLLQLSDDEVARGVVAVSGGNHGLAVAYAARELGVAATVLMPATTAAGSIRQARADGAEVVILEAISDVFAQAVHEVEAGKVMIHPFDDPAVIAGQGTLALELFEDAPEITDVIASIGGGGMITGAATALHGLDPDIRIWGVETVGADAMSRSLAAGKPVTLDKITSIATTLGAPTVADRTLTAVQKHVEQVLLVSDEEAVHGIDAFAQTAKLLTEPAAGATWAAALRLRERLPADARVALVVCGGNVGIDDIGAWRSRFPSPSG